MSGYENCPSRAQHTPDPDGYVAWFDWAAEMHKTHKQVRCKGCGRFAIWVPKEPAQEPVTH